jgi:hypothetical protein
MFDCVMPTRNARNGWLFTRWGDIQDQERQTQAGHPPARRKLRLLRLPQFQPRLPAPPVRAQEMLGRNSTPSTTCTTTSI